MRVEYDAKADILYIRFSDRPPVESEHLDNDVVVDYDDSDKIVAVEILDFKKRSQKSFTIPVEFHT